MCFRLSFCILHVDVGLGMKLTNCNANSLEKMAASCWRYVRSITRVQSSSEFVLYGPMYTPCKLHACRYGRGIVRLGKVWNNVCKPPQLPAYLSGSAGCYQKETSESV